MSARMLVTVVALASLANGGVLRAQDDGLDSRAVALNYHKLTKDPLDVQAVAARSPAMQAASSFDRPDVLKVQTAQLERDLASADASRELVVRVNDNISDYDHERGEFSIMLFRPGHYVPVTEFGQQYRLVFANAEAARPIAMAKDQARAFDAKLAAMGRGVTNEIHFRVTGAGDPAGAIIGPRVIRADIISARLLDRNGNVVFTPAITASNAPLAVASTRVDLAHADVAGMRVGVRARDLEATLARMFGPVARRPRSTNWYAGYSSALLVNEMGCMELPNGRQPPQPGTVCVSAYADDKDIVRSIRVERVFPYLDQEAFRAALVQKYGPVTKAIGGGTYTLGWGAPLDSSVAFDRSGPGTAITAYYLTNDNLFSRGNNALPKIRVVLELVDAAWSSARKQ